MRIQILAAAAAAMTLAVPVAVPVAMADPAGTVPVNQIPTLRPGISVLGASSAGVLYRVERPPYMGGSQWTYLKPTGKPAYQVPNEFNYLAGDKAYARYTTDGHVHYLIVGSTVVHRCDDLAQPAPAYVGSGTGSFTSFGWLSDFDNGVRVVADATGCRIAGRAPGVGSYNLAGADEKGYALIWEVGDNERAMEYRSYAAPDKAVAIQTTGHTKFLGGVDLDGDVITWSHLDYDAQGIEASFVVRSSTTGGPATVSRVEGVLIGNTAIAGDRTGWTGCNQDHADCRIGTIDGTVIPGSYSLASDGTRFLFDTYGSSPGIDALAGEQRTRVATVGLVPPETFEVSIGASTIAYVDNQLGMNGESPVYTLSRRSFGKTLALSAQTRLGQVGTRVVGRDGRRTAYVDTAGDLWIVRDDGVRSKVFDAVDDVAQVRSGVRLSGHRLLWVKGNYTGDYCPPWGCSPTYENLRLMLYDVRTGKSIDLGPRTNSRPMTLWGSYLVYVDASNRILRKDLSSGAVVQVKGAGSARVAGLDVYGSLVAWSTCTGIDNYGDCQTSRIAYRVMTTSSVVERASTHSGAVRLSGGYLVHSTQQTLDDTPLLKVWRLGSQTVTTIGPLGSPLGDIHDETLAWIGSDRIARLTPLAPFTARPRYLGNALGSASFAPGKGQAWTPEFAISKALPSCTVTITSGTAVRRTMSCATTVGAARVTWNGRDSASRLLPKGRYTWTLTGADSDGSLLWWTGSANPIRGTVTIT